VLLDRKRVKFWQKWVFGFMAIIMAAFLVMIPVNRYVGCGGGSSAASAVEQINKDIAKFKAQTTADPGNVDAWLGLAQNYLYRANQQQQGSAAEQTDLNAAVAAYRQADRVLRKDKGAAAKQRRLDTLEQLATVYLSLQDYGGALSIYQKITGLQPKDAQSFLNLGEIAVQAGDKATAMLAFTRFLQLDPASPDAAAVKEWLNQATASPSPSASATGSPSPSPSSSGATP
jgi:tetratricopeptide (TPR) repeat protein